MADEGYTARTMLPGWNRLKTEFWGAMMPGTSSGWVVSDNGGCSLASNKSSKTLIIPLNGVRDGDKIVNVRIVGSAAGLNTAGVTATGVLKKITKATSLKPTGIATATVVGKGCVPGGAAIDKEITPSTEVTVMPDYQYFVYVTATTPNHAKASMAIIGVEADIRRA